MSSHCKLHPQAAFHAKTTGLFVGLHFYSYPNKQSPNTGLSAHTESRPSSTQSITGVMGLLSRIHKMFCFDYLDTNMYLSMIIY